MSQPESRSQEEASIMSARGLPVASSAEAGSTSIMEESTSSKRRTIVDHGAAAAARALLSDSSDEELDELGSAVSTSLGSSSPDADGHQPNPFQNLRDIARGEQKFRDDTDNLALYQSEITRRPRVARILSNLIRFNGQTEEPDEAPLNAEASMLALLRKNPVKMGTISGVYLPCIQNILGVMLFLRIAWMVGSAGVGESLLIVLICCSTTMLTAISMSAIATNGVVPAGGAYFMISRSLGPEFGGAVGILFYLGTTFASSMYILGAIEILMTYIAPGMSAFGDAAPGSADMLNNMRLYGTILLFLMGLIVFVGVKYVNRFASVCLVLVVLSILCIYIGFFASPQGRQPDVCLIDGALISSEYDGSCTAADVSNTTDWPTVNSTFSGRIPGFPGLSSGIFGDNVGSSYLREGETLPGRPAEQQEVVADITSSFTILLAIFFPACTGIMAGSNRSGDLIDASRSIPVGTIAAIATTTLIYLTIVMLLGGTTRGVLLRDKYGDSIDGGLVIAEVAWPHPVVILVGALLSTIGAGLQSLTGAPRLLQAIAQDNLLPFLSFFSKAAASGEPTRALILTLLISECGVLIASLDAVAPIITMFFLMCYAFVNLACSLQSLLKSPSWRPRFKYYHWGLSALGLMLCILLMFISSWFYALAAIILATCIYYYIEFKGAAKEWGDGIRGLSMQAARFSLLRLEDAEPHTKNWRPQILTLLKLQPETLDVAEPRLIALAGNLKGGKGLNLCATVLEGSFTHRMGERLAGILSLKRAMKAAKVQGFTEVLVTPDVPTGISALIQGSGLGAMKHNTILLGWPEGWRRKLEAAEQEDAGGASSSDGGRTAASESATTAATPLGAEGPLEGGSDQVEVFMTALLDASAAQLAVVIPKNIHLFPDSATRLDGTIDVYWVVHDGGMLLLLAFLLQHDLTWRKCRIRVFTVAESDDNSIQLQRDLQQFLYHLRIDADVRVVEMLDSDVSVYTKQRAERLARRNRLMRKLNLTKRQRNRVVDEVLNRATRATERAAARAGDVTAQESESLEEENLRRMNTSVKLNKIIRENSSEASLVLLNLPGPPEECTSPDSPHAVSYLEFVEVLTENLQRVIMVRGGGREVITIYS